MIREEFITAAGIWSERLLLAVQDLPESSFAQVIGSGDHTVHELISARVHSGEFVIRTLERLYHGASLNEVELPLTTPFSATSFKKTLAAFRIAHSTVIAALERIPLERFAGNGELPAWLMELYLHPLQQMVPAIETWAADLRARGYGGPTGLPVIKQ